MSHVMKLMINRKNQDSSQKHEFWSHFHHMLDISVYGNEKIFERLNHYSSVNNFFEKNFLLANIPEKYFDFELDKIRDKIETLEPNIEQINKIEKYIDLIDNAAKKGTGLYISGSHGVGKTAIAIIILKTAIKHYYPSFFSRSTEIIELVNNSIFFVIDDIGRLFSEISDYERSNIDSIFTKRDDSNLCTIITANHSLETNKDLLGDSLYSNFRERLVEVKLLGEDYRNIIGQCLLDRL